VLQARWFGLGRGSRSMAPVAHGIAGLDLPVPIVNFATLRTELESKPEGVTPQKEILPSFGWRRSVSAIGTPGS
jgi:hypothetical protein